MKIDPQKLQILDHKERMISARLKQNMAKQYELQNEEGRLRTELTHIENDRYRLLRVN